MESGQQATTLYNFLSAQYDKMNNAEKDARLKNKLLGIITKDTEYGL